MDGALSVSGTAGTSARSGCAPVPAPSSAATTAGPALSASDAAGVWAPSAAAGAGALPSSPECAIGSPCTRVAMATGTDSIEPCATALWSPGRVRPSAPMSHSTRRSFERYKGTALVGFFASSLARPVNSSRRAEAISSKASSSTSERSDSSSTPIRLNACAKWAEKRW